MKLQKLFFHAFGPFTGTVLDFSGSAQLHLIYGPNEAGKSSALRAIADLRYGIAGQSKDNFVHAYRDMSLAGTFVDAAGQVCGLVRRKGNKDTLLRADPDTGLPLADSADSAVTPAMLLALTGGVDRAQFEILYGMDAARLRQGGKMLIQGEGELGAALFEASTGTANIQALLTTLANDAKQYFAPRGQSMVLNEAARQIDEAQQRYKKTIARPDHWKQLERTQQEALQQLADIRAQLGQRRVRMTQLTHLRAVEPLLRDLDTAARDWQQLQAHVALAADARDQRLAAQNQAQHAEHTLQDAQAALQQCQQDLQALQPEPLLLAHSTAIERLQADATQVLRARDECIRLQASTHADVEQLSAQAERCGLQGGALHSLHALTAQLPSAHEYSAAEQTLQQWQEAEQALHRASARHSELIQRQQQLQQLQQQAQQLAMPELQAALSVALQRAQALGDAEPRCDALQQAIAAEKRQLQRTLTEMGLATAQGLARSGHVASATIDAYEAAHSDWQRAMVLLQDKWQTLDTDLAEQQRRRASLGAVGEVVTAATLQQARALRERSWHSVRAACIDAFQAADLVARTAVAQSFERSQHETDRQADLLREGAQRAAHITECEQRIAAMQQAQQVLAISAEQRRTAQADSTARWQQALTDAGVPVGNVAEVREWLQQRHSALAQQERCQQKQDEQAALQTRLAAAHTALLTALADLGAVLPPDATDLASRVAVGVALERELVRQRAAIDQRQQDLAALAQDLQAQGRQVAEQQQQLQASQNALDAHCQRLHLAAGSTPAQVRERLQALRTWASAYQLHREQQLQLDALQAHAKALRSDAAALGALLNEVPTEPIDGWIGTLAQRLTQSREASALQATLRKTEAAEQRRYALAQTEQATAQQTLAALCAQAQVVQAEDLPAAEEAADKRRTGEQRLLALTAQLAKASVHDVAALRVALAEQDSAALEQEMQAGAAQLAQLEREEQAAIAAEHTAQQALAAIDTSGAAAQAREEMESAVARYRAGVRPWAQLKLAHALLSQALQRHREQAQGPVLALASNYFCQITGGRFARLLVDAEGDTPVLLAQPAQGQPIGITGLSEGTADQLHLALRLAALQVQRQPDRPMPLVLDDVLMTSDDSRAAHMLQALAQFSAQHQVLVFTHHQHLLEIATRSLPAGAVQLHTLA